MKWFLLKNEEIRGPFKTAQIVENCDDQSLIWGPGMSEWTNKQSWISFLNRPKQEAKATEKEEVTGSNIDTKSVEEVAEFALHQLNDNWYFALEGKKFGPFNQRHLILKISSIEQVEKVLLWKKGEKAWRPIYEFPKILNILNDQLDQKKAA